jgi:hypothetical protein
MLSISKHVLSDIRYPQTRVWCRSLLKAMAGQKKKGGEKKGGKKGEEKKN